MDPCVGIRREDKSVWERRVPLVPEQVKSLVEEGIKVVIQPSEIRVFKEDEYLHYGAKVDEDLSECPIVFAIKEIPKDLFREGGTYSFFSHTIKGQKKNMPMLKRLMELKCNLIDYERVVDEKNRRLIFFGRHAGMAGMVESLAALGQRLEADGVQSPFSAIKQPRHYDNKGEILAVLEVVGKWIVSGGLPEALRPMVIGFAGYGNVSQGAQEMLENLPVKEIRPSELASISKDAPGADRTVFKVVFKEEDMVVPKKGGAAFDLQDYYAHPERYDGVFETYLPNLTVLVNCIYWTERYPRLVTKDWLKQHWKGSGLRVIGDISCDIGGSIEPTHKATNPGEPCFVYEPGTDTFRDGIEGDGPVIMAVDILPSELPRDASRYFGGVLMEYVPAMAKADYSVPFEELDLPAPIKRAVIVYHGQLTPEYQYMERFLG